MRVRLVVVVLVMLTLALALTDAFLIALPRTNALPDVYGLRGAPSLFGALGVGIGGAIALRQPWNTVGWILLVTGPLAPFSDSAGEYASYALLERGGALPGGAWAAWLSQLALMVAVGPISTYLLLVFPDGRLPSERWRPVAWFTVLTLILASAVLVLVTPVGYFAPSVAVPNPVSLGIRIELDQSAQLRVAAILFVPVVMLCGAALVQRFRHSRGIERLQLKWIAYAAVIGAALWLVVPASPGNKPLEVLKQLGTGAIPVAAGIAILRYRLYDIDLLINRTLVYGSVTAVLGATYVFAVLVSQQLLRGLTGGSDIAVAGSTLLVVALFQPIRRRVQDFVDRRFYRARYDAQRTTDAFIARLRHDVDLDSVRADLLRVVHRAIQPAHASVWLRSGRR